MSTVFFPFCKYFFAGSAVRPVEAPQMQQFPLRARQTVDLLVAGEGREEAEVGHGFRRRTGIGAVGSGAP